MFMHALHTDVTMTDKIPRRRHPGGKGSLLSTQSRRRRHNRRGCGGRLVADSRRTQGEGLGVKWLHRNWGVRRNRGPSWTGRWSKETKSSGTWAQWGSGSPGVGDRVWPIPLRDRHGSRWGVEGVPRSGSSGWTGGRNKLWSRGCRRHCGCSGSRERCATPLGCIQSHWVRTAAAIKTVDNIDNDH